MAKSVKYEMSFNTMFLYIPSIQITKKEFERQLKHYKNEITQNHIEYKDEIAECDADGKNRDNIEGYIDNMDIKVSEYEKYTETRYLIRTNEISISLWKKRSQTRISLEIKKNN